MLRSQSPPKHRQVCDRCSCQGFFRFVIVADQVTASPNFEYILAYVTTFPTTSPTKKEVKAMHSSAHSTFSLNTSLQAALDWANSEYRLHAGLEKVNLEAPLLHCLQVYVPNSVSQVSNSLRHGSTQKQSCKDRSHHGQRRGQLEMKGSGWISGLFASGVVFWSHLAGVARPNRESEC